MEKENFDINSGRALIFEDDNGCFTLSPRGCFLSALSATNIISQDDPVENNDSVSFDGAFSVLVSRYKEKNWLKYDDKEKPSGRKKDQKKVFVDTIYGFFPNATKDQAVSAFDLFFIELEKHGWTTKQEKQ